jgi:signal transduction histidine kinase
MRERAEIAGGTFRVDSVPGRGTRVVAEIPLPEGGEAATAGADEGGERT